MVTAIINGKRVRRPTHPGRIVEHEVRRYNGLGYADLAVKIGVGTQRCIEICEGKAPVTEDVAICLSEETNTSKECWVNMQKKFDDWEAAACALLEASPGYNVPFSEVQKTKT